MSAGTMTRTMAERRANLAQIARENPAALRDSLSFVGSITPEDNRTLMALGEVERQAALAVMRRDRAGADAALLKVAAGDSGLPLGTVVSE